MIHRGRLFAPGGRVPARRRVPLHRPGIRSDRLGGGRSWPAGARRLSCDAVAGARMLAPMSALDPDLHQELEHAIAPAVAAPAEEQRDRAPGAELASSVG